MGNLTISATFVTVLNVLMFLGQAAMLDLNPTGTDFYNCNGSIMNEFGSCESYVIDTEGVGGDLPTAEGSISPTTGNLFTDTFSSIKTWISTKLTFITQILAAPYNLIKAIPGLPEAFVYAMGTLWYIISLIIVVAFLWGRE
jgi:hypothetical protein